MRLNKRKSQVKDIIELYKEIEMLKTELKAMEIKKGADDDMH